MGLAKRFVVLAYLLAASWLVCGDVYMHNPRGSNNRLNERSANRRNANRMFDSQNNNRGGYNAGDTDDQNGFNSEEEIYYMKYFQSGMGAGQDSLLQIEWTNQHGCGGNEENDPHKLNCNIVLQYFMPQTFRGTQEVTETSKFTQLRNGENTNTQNFAGANINEAQSAFTTRRNNNVQADRGLHETFEFYDDCNTRARNNGLFTADQRLRGSTAKYTRQNPNGNRRGYECPEERDYYPYWHPTPWRDIAILTDDVSLCDYYRSESFNVKPKGHCRQMFPNSNQPSHRSPYNNPEDCANPPDGGTAGEWFEEYAYIDIATGSNQQQCTNLNSTLSARGYRTMWAAPSFGSNMQCLILPPAPDCIQAPWSRVNHLGNGRDGVPLNYTWRIPPFINNQEKLTSVRIRYNISTDDYHPWQTNASHNANRLRGRRSPVEQNPNVDIGLSNNKPLRLAINTAQFGRTFQDRSHVIQLRPRSMLREEDRGCVLHNLNVRGKRGNIVQTYPAVEYDFIPNRLTISDQDCLHIQWTGSNTHNNGAPGGDGQTGDAGEGRGGTDRHNMVPMRTPDGNYPCRSDNCGDASSIFQNAEVVYSSTGRTDISPQDLELMMASGGYYQCLNPVTGCSSESVRNKEQMNQLLNNVSPSFPGVVLKMRAGNYYYMCTRNNNFTNRSQKGMLMVTASS